tara:strand:+ start:936 stop:2003 length:1068 start_codon:yes stop_codon:yes gene_type:complete
MNIETKVVIILASFISTLSLTSCNNTTSEPQDRLTLTIMTHDSFAVSEEVLSSFQNQHNVKVNILNSGDASTTVNLAILNKSEPLADVIYGIDNTLLTRALDNDILAKYKSPNAYNVEKEFLLDTQQRVTPINYGDVCLNYDKSYFNSNNIEIPDSLQSLTNPDYANLLVVQNPAASSPGLAFLLATIGHFGPDKYLDYWLDLKNNGVKIVENWETAYYTEFSGSSGKGDYPLVVSYASSPPAEVIFATETITEAPTGSIIADETCFRQIEFVGILKGTKNRILSEAWIDFMLDKAFQEDIPLQMFMFPVKTEAKLPLEFIEHAQLANKPSIVSPEDIDTHRENWIKSWSALMLN